MSASSADRRLRNLDNRLLVTVVFMATMALYLYCALQSEHAYGDTRFAIGYPTTELQVAAVETRSRLVPIHAHALYDFPVIDMASLMHADASGVPMMVVSAIGVLASIASLIRIARLQAREPYGA